MRLHLEKPRLEDHLSYLLVQEWRKARNKFTAYNLGFLLFGHSHFFGSRRVFRAFLRLRFADGELTLRWAKGHMGPWMQETNELANYNKIPWFIIILLKIIMGVYNGIHQFKIDIRKTGLSLLLVEHPRSKLLIFEFLKWHRSRQVKHIKATFTSTFFHQWSF